MTAFLIDEMFPASTAAWLREKYSYDAVHVTEIGLRGAPDEQVAATARAESRVIVTENVADFSAEREVTVIFVLKRKLPSGDGQATALAVVLDRWSHENPEPYLGPHWPRAG